MSDSEEIDDNELLEHAEYLGVDLDKEPQFEGCVRRCLWHQHCCDISTWAVVKGFDVCGTGQTREGVTTGSSPFGMARVHYSRWSHILLP
jgi:uncharacterized protein YuzB (UPF0349 family)